MPEGKLPKDLLIHLQRDHGYDHFIETGTFYGQAASWAAEHFSRVTTIELAREIYEQTSQNLAHITNIDFVYGDTRAILRGRVPQLTQPAVFWLDAHWSVGRTYGDGDECPVMDEIDIIVNAAPGHILLIDDVHMFLAPPPPPHHVEQWPTITDVLTGLAQDTTDRYTVIFNNVIISVPLDLKPMLIEYCRQRLSLETAAATPQALPDSEPGLAAKVRWKLKSFFGSRPSDHINEH